MSLGLVPGRDLKLVILVWEQFKQKKKTIFNTNKFNVRFIDRMSEVLGKSRSALFSAMTRFKCTTVLEKVSILLSPDIGTCQFTASDRGPLKTHGGSQPLMVNCSAFLFVPIVWQYPDRWVGQDWSWNNQQLFVLLLSLSRQKTPYLDQTQRKVGSDSVTFYTLCPLPTQSFQHIPSPATVPWMRWTWISMFTQNC